MISVTVRQSVRRSVIPGLGMMVLAVLLLSTVLVRHRRMRIHSQQRHVQPVIRQLLAAAAPGPGLATGGIVAVIQAHARCRRVLMADGRVGIAVQQVAAGGHKTVHVRIQHLPMVEQPVAAAAVMHEILIHVLSMAVGPVGEAVQ